MQFPVFLRLHRSSLVERCYWLTTLLACAGLLAAEIPAWVLGFALALVMVSVGQAYRQRQPASLELRLDAKGALAYREGDAWQKCQLVSGTLIHPWLTVLQVTTPVGKACWLVLPDAIAANDFRLLRQWLKWKQPSDGTPSGS